MKNFENSNYAKCFISYCHEDVPKKSVEEIVEGLRTEAKGNIVFYFDEDNKTGTELNNFMDRILTCDSVIVICSPKYKQKIDEIGGNINYEFDLIIKKYDEYFTIKNNSSLYNKIPETKFAIFPIIISDIDKEKVSKNDSYPDYLCEHNIVYKRYTFVSKNTKREISEVKGKSGEKNTDREKQLISFGKQIKKINEENKKIINRIVSQTLSIKLSRPITCQEKDTRIAKLIKYTKAEINGNLGPVFCRTKFYDELLSQTKKVFVGRKGSGKSQTILQFIDENKDDYKGVIKIDANNINIYALLDALRSNLSGKELETELSNRFSGDFNISNGAQNDIDNYFSFEGLLRYTWYSYIYLYSIYIIAAEDMRGNLSDCQKKNFRLAKTFINRLLKNIDKSERWNNPPEVSTALYEYSFYKAMSFFEEIIDKSRNDNTAQTFSDIRASNSLSNLLKYIITQQGFNSFKRTLNNCTKKIFLCLDGFDNIQEEQRGKRFSLSNMIDDPIINKFEAIWLTSLVDVIYQIVTDSNDSNKKLLLMHIDICLMVPYDRYMQASYSKRDGFVYREFMSSVNYTGIELCDLFTKRLQVIVDSNMSESTKPSNTIIQTLEEVLKRFSNLDSQIEITLKNNQKILFPLFLYLLRYSFWRPRDIIDHIEAVFKTVINGEELNCRIDTEMIVGSANISTERIVYKTIEEFKDLWLNINECLDKLYYRCILMTYDEFESFIRESGFIIKLSNGESYSEVRDIIKFLYRIGFIGLMLSNTNRKSIRSPYRQHQIFYSYSAIRNISDDSFKENSIFFNPVFHFKYNLRIETNEIIGIHTWEELKKRDIGIGTDFC